MNEQSNGSQYHRFYRDGAPYMSSLEDVLSKLIVVQKGSSEYLLDELIALMRGIHDRLADCQSVLGQAEQLVEDARERGAEHSEIGKMVAICIELQRIQTRMAKDCENTVNHMMDKVFPRS